MRVALLSGDRSSAVEGAAREAGITTWLAELTPARKIAWLAEREQEGRKVLMVGDGLNDAPALAAAHASLSPATAADISQRAADFVFQGQSLAPVLDVISISKRARSLAFQNFGVAFCYNIVAVPFAMAGFVTPLIAAIVMSTSSILVTLNAARLAGGRAVTALAWLVPAALLLGALGLLAFLWALRSGQFEDLEGAAYRALEDDPLDEPGRRPRQGTLGPTPSYSAYTRPRRRGLSMAATEANAPNVAITYCRLCGWLLRASWMAQELLTTFAEEVGSVTLIPDDTGGVFEIRLDGCLDLVAQGPGALPRHQGAEAAGQGPDRA